MASFTLDVISEWLLRGRVKFHTAQRICADYGIELRREPMGVTFWRSGRRIHGVFNFNPAEV